MKEVARWRWKVQGVELAVFLCDKGAWFAAAIAGDPAAFQVHVFGPDSLDPWTAMIALQKQICPGFALYPRNS